MKFIKEFLTEADKKQEKRILRNITHLSPRESILNGQKVLNFSSNDYLGLSFHPKVIERAIEWSNKFGAGSAASRLVTGTNPAYTKLETQITQWKGFESALILGSGYMANLGIIPALSNKKTVIFADKLNHASLNSGCQLSLAKFVRYNHNDLNHLQKLIDKYENYQKLIISDTIFSMDGDIAQLAKLAQLAKKNNAYLYLDDAHASGIFGEKGKGLATDCDFAMGTFSKALGSYGAYIACSSDIKEYLINRCSSFIYTTALPPSVYGSISAAIELIQTNEFCTIRKELQKKSEYVVYELNKMGFNTGKTLSPIIPIIMKESNEVLKFSEKLLNNDILGVSIRPPTVPVGAARVRLTINATHTKDDIDKLLTVSAQVAKTLKKIK